MNLVHTVRRRAELQPGMPAIVDRTIYGDRVISYGSLVREVEHQATWLTDHDVLPGDTVLMVLEPSQEFYVHLLSLLQIGAVPVICDVMSTARGLPAWLKHCSPKACVLPKSRWLHRRFFRHFRTVTKRFPARGNLHLNGWWHGDRLSRPIDRPESAEALLELKSGRVNHAAVLSWSQQQLELSARRLTVHLKMRAGEIDLCGRPQQLLANLSAGITSVIPARRTIFRSLRKRQMDKFKPVRVTDSSAFLIRYLRTRSTSLHKVYVLDAPLAPGEIDFFVRCQHHANIELLFSTAAPLAVCHLRESRSTSSLRFAGTFFDDVRHRVDPVPLPASDASRIPGNGPVGELLVAGEFLPRPLLADGSVDQTKVIPNGHPGPWLRTGKFGQFDDEGRFWLAATGRLATV